MTNINKIIYAALMAQGYKYRGEDIDQNGANLLLVEKADTKYKISIEETDEFFNY